MILRNFDAFSKIDSSVLSSSESGGILSIVMLLLIAYLFIAETIQWQTIRYDYEYLVDQTSNNVPLEVNIDMTVAMSCDFLRVDVLDSSKELSPVSNLIRATKTRFNRYSATNFTDNSKKGTGKAVYHADERTDRPNACHISGTFDVKKLEGMITIS